MKKKTLFLIIAISIIIYFLVELVGALNHISKMGFSKEPEDFKTLFKKENEFKISHAITSTYDKKTPFSGYHINGREYGMSILRLPSSHSKALGNTMFLKDKKTNKAMREKVSILGGLDYSRSNIKSVKKLKIYIENYKQNYVKFQNDSVIYLTFNLNRNLAIDFESSKEIDIHTDVSKSHDPVYNELMIIDKNGYLYFIYLREFKKKSEHNNVLERMISL